MRSKSLVSFFLIFFVLLSFVGCLSFVGASATHTVVFNETTGGMIFFRYHTNPVARYLAGSYVFTHGEYIEINAVPASGYIFSHFNFSGYVAGSTAVIPLDISVVSDFAITASFIAISSANDTVTATTTVGGQLIVESSSINNYAPFTKGFPTGSWLNVRASPTYGYQFVNVTITGGSYAGVYSDGEFDMQLDDDVAIAAYFEADYVSGDLYHFSVTAITDYGDYYRENDDAGGNVLIEYSPNVFGRFPNTYSYDVYGGFDVYAGSLITLTADANSGFEFSYFMLDGVVLGNVTGEVYGFSVSSDMAISMVFTSLSSSGGNSGLDYWNDLSGSFKALPDFLKLVIIFIVVLGLPLLVVVMIPQVGFIGFVGMLCFTLALGVMFFGFPFWVLIFVAMGVALMLFSLMSRS